MFKKVVLPSIALSGVIFTSFAMVLVKYGSERIEIKVDNQDLIYGEVRDFISPGMGTILSLTLGAASILAIGYGESVRRKENLEKQLLSVKKAISNTDIQIQEQRKLEKINH